MITLEFSDADIDALDYERYHHPSPQVQRKMEVLYLKSQGLPHEQIRQLSRIRSRTTLLVRYLRQYEAGGIEALKQLYYKGQPSELNQHTASLKDHFEWIEVLPTESHPNPSLSQAHRDGAAKSGLYPRESDYTRETKRTRTV